MVELMAKVFAYGTVVVRPSVCL